MRTCSRQGFGPEDMIEKWVREKMNKSARPGQSAVEDSHIGLMNSPGHRKNILEPTIEIVGIGIVNQGRALWLTQMFSVRKNFDLKSP